jgi:glycerol-3-phosphate acyltransferase PlsX
MSNGTEDCKGSETSLATYALLDALNKKGLLPFEFVGNTEGHDLFEHGLDVAVTDGFTGNILLKCVESTAKFFSHTMKAAIKSSFMAMLGALGMSSVFKTLRKRMSADAVGGSPLIGVNGLSIIAHGSATGVAILNAIRMACDMHGNNINEQIVKHMGAINEALKEVSAE